MRRYQHRQRVVRQRQVRAHQHQVRLAAHRRRVAAKRRRNTVFDQRIGNNLKPLRQAQRRAARRSVRALASMPDTRRVNRNTRRRLQRESALYRRRTHSLYDRARRAGLIHFREPALRVEPLRYNRAGYLSGRPRGYAAVVHGLRGRVNVTPDTVGGAVNASDRRRRQYYRTVPIHEWAHTHQKPLRRDWLEGGAELFRRRVTHGIGVARGRQSPGYASYIRRVQRNAPKGWVLRGQFRHPRRRRRRRDRRLSR